MPPQHRWNQHEEEQAAEIFTAASNDRVATTSQALF
jgi:hypothetical protein